VKCGDRCPQGTGHTFRTGGTGSGENPSCEQASVDKRICERSTSSDLRPGEARRGEAGRALIAGRGGPGRRPGSEPADRGRRLDGGGDLLCFRHADVRSSRPPTRLNMAVGRSVGRLSAVEQVWTLDGTASRDGRQQQQQPRAGQRSSDGRPTADTVVCHATAPQQTLVDPCSVKRKR